MTWEQKLDEAQARCDIATEVCLAKLDLLAIGSYDTTAIRQKTPSVLLGMLEEKSLTASFVFGKSKDGEGDFVGHAVLGQRDADGDRLLPGALFESIQQAGGSFPLLRDGDKNQICGCVDVLEDGQSLHIRAKLANTQLGRETRELIGLGNLSTFGILFRPVDGGVKYNGGQRDLSRVHLMAISLSLFDGLPGSHIERTH